MPAHKFWTPEKKVRMQELLETMTILDAANALGVTPAAIKNQLSNYRKLHRIKPVSGPKVPDMRVGKERSAYFSAIIPALFINFRSAPSLPPAPSRTCAYAMTDTKPFLFCDEPSKPGKSYCELHYNLSVRAPTDYEAKMLKELKYVK